MAPASDYSTALPCPSIVQAETINDKLALTRYSANHAPGGHAAKQGDMAMYFRTFDRYGGKALPANWRSMVPR